ncbi:hypothetical protein SAMN02745248_00231 [Hathewaya proteolytica DSM 3090]|uniref:Uncharacterized protein n=1 Tax=Hathewaya proteolytica DSM 3090 TaxID=1121331 RepID=A0A1M6JL83_9CLOT|nr:hypothetical protein [Hathewaya proteolytica]SHJ47392.1 hypothetical protein SAMN02745248_00231 [Hathewaya proteolytica DSM 3090]
MSSFEKYPSVLLDGDEYSMIPIKSGLDLEEEVSRQPFLRNDDVKEIEKEPSSTENEEEFITESSERSFKPVFGVPLFIEETYMDDEDNYRGKKHQKERCEDSAHCIFEHIQRCHPQIYKTLKRYGMNGAEAKKTIMRIIVLSTMYKEER